MDIMRCLIFMMLIGYAGLVMVSLLRKLQLFKPLCAADNVLDFYSTLKSGVFVQNVTLQFYLFWAYFRKYVCQNAFIIVSRFCVLRQVRVMYQNK